jgi:hypothetical protein
MDSAVGLGDLGLLADGLDTSVWGEEFSQDLAEAEDHARAEESVSSVDLAPSSISATGPPLLNHVDPDVPNLVDLSEKVEDVQPVNETIGINSDFDMQQQALNESSTEDDDEDMDVESTKDDEFDPDGRLEVESEQEDEIEEQQSKSTGKRKRSSKSTGKASAANKSSRTSSKNNTASDDKVDADAIVASKRSSRNVEKVDYKAIANGPKSLRRLVRPRKQEYNEDGDKIYCICRQPDEGLFMIQCDTCKDWYVNRRIVI